jgi:hypothetical protein
MNKDFLAITVLFIFASPFLALIFIIAFKVYRKFRPSQEKIPAKKQPNRMLDEQSVQHMSASPGRRMADLIATAFLVLLAGGLAGIIAAIVSQLIYIVLVFPLLIGFVGGRVIMGAIQMAKIRKAPQMILLSFVAAIAIYGTYHYGRYIGLQIETSFTMFPGFSEATADKHLSAAKAFVDYALEKETGYSGFVGYMLFKAKEGVSIGRFYHSDRLNLGPVLTWFYWALEFGIILAITIYTGRNLIRRPFCESCGNWYSREKHLGGTNSANGSVLAELITQKDFIQIGRLLEEDAGLPSLEVYWQGCEVCGKSRSQLVVRRAFQSQKGGLYFTDASRTVLQPLESARLVSQLKLVDNLS